MSINSVIPLRFSRLVTLFLAWEWAVVSLAVEINAFVKSKKAKDAIMKIIPAQTTISFDSSDVFQSSAVVTTVSALILVLCTVYFIILLVDIKSRSGVSTRTLTLQYLSLAICVIVLFATQVAVSIFVSTRSVKVSASVDGLALPDSVVQTVERELGVSTEYSSFEYLVLIAVLPWFTFLFTLIAVIVTFIASRRETSSGTTGSSSRRKGETTADKMEMTSVSP
ncbi:hypothetical protein B0H17DRAFT_1335341 [Mycena rosella]|uniref:Uncharacterized protein n=1 Tax=Mycena rosella TaxID=1033263 RepID=A0AAD7G964_MYCRO|nr:hypothetical protein B0H17DRAFT_1335341 [Mycena rosella]